MNAKELASILNGREYGLELDDLDMEALRESGLVIAYGAGDDLLELDGAISEELDAWNGLRVQIFSGEVVRPEESSAAYRLMSKYFHQISAEWARADCTWFIDTDMPHEPFRIFYDGELFCHGIVFRLSDTNPSMDSVPHGQWEYTPIDGKPYCSECQRNPLLGLIAITGSIYLPHCPNCGAKMAGKK